MFRLLLPFLLFLLVVTGGCASLVVRPALDSLSSSLERQEDLELIREGAPALLLMIDGLLAGEPKNPDLLIAGAKAYSAYGLALFEKGEEARARTVIDKARTYSLALLALHPGLAEVISGDLSDFQKVVATFTKGEVAHLFWGGQGWGSWISLQEGAPAAMAELPRVEILMQRVLALDETFYHGSAHIFLGSYYGSRPKMYGGRPEASRDHFERALEISNRDYLLAQVAYARTYARMIYDRDLFESLLGEVMAQPLVRNELTSSNQLAKFMAKKLLSQVDELF